MIMWQSPGPYAVLGFLENGMIGSKTASSSPKMWRILGLFASERRTRPDRRDLLSPRVPPAPCAKGVKIVLGPETSSNLRNIKGYADSNQMLLVSCCSTSPSLAIEGDTTVS